MCVALLDPDSERGGMPLVRRAEAAVRCAFACSSSRDRLSSGVEAVLRRVARIEAVIGSSDGSFGFISTPVARRMVWGDTVGGASGGESTSSGDGRTLHAWLR